MNGRCARVWMLTVCWMVLAFTPRPGVAQPARAPVIAVETSKGAFIFETFPDEAPHTVQHVVGPVKDGFYDGQRFHRMIPGFVVQWGDPQSRDLLKEPVWGRGAAAASGHPIGAFGNQHEATSCQGRGGDVSRWQPGARRQPAVRHARRSQRSEWPVHCVRARGFGRRCPREPAAGRSWCAGCRSSNSAITQPSIPISIARIACRLRSIPWLGSSMLDERRRRWTPDPQTCVPHPPPGGSGSASR